MKKILACLLAVCMVFAMMPIAVMAADEVASVTDPNGVTANYATLADALAAVKSA